MGDLVLVSGAEGPGEGADSDRADRFQGDDAQDGQNLGTCQHLYSLHHDLPPPVARLAYNWRSRKEGFIDRTLDILWLNDFIMDLNTSNNEACSPRHEPQLHLYGLKQ